MNRKPNIVITIGRQFGSGGREIGQALAKAFGINYYDKKLLAEAAAHAGYAETYFEHNDERAPQLLGSSIGFSMGYGQIPWYNPRVMTDNHMYGSLADVITRLAETESCVIVGRSADHVLRDHKGPMLKLFVHAPIEERVQRILARCDEAKPAAAKSLAKKTDRLRAEYYNFYTDKKWGDASTYDLTLDSSLLSPDDICEVVATYIQRRFGFDPRK